MNRASHRVARRLAVVSLSASALLAAGAPAGAQCGTEVVLTTLDAGVSSPVLRTPLGAAVIGGPFGFRVHDAPTEHLGVLIYSGFEDPVFDPVINATVWPQVPWFTWLFGTGPTGTSPVFLGTPEVTDDLCGVEATFQAVIIAPSAPGGVLVTNAVRLRVGVPNAPLFEPASEVLVNPYTDAIGGDIDGDGLVDVLGVHAKAASARLGLPGGGFAPPFTFAFPDVPNTPSGVVRGPVSPVLADVNGDGFDELVVAGRGNDRVTVLVLGPGGWIAAPSYPTANEPTFLAAGDVDLDGRVDLLVGHDTSTQIELLRGGNGTLLLPVGIEVGAPQLDVALGDLDEDGVPDLLYSTTSLRVALGNGDGTFGASSSHGAVGLEDLTVRDIDLDGSLDVAGFSYNTMSVMLGNGDGTLGSTHFHSFIAAEVGHLTFADLDGDSLAEALAMTYELDFDEFPQVELVLACKGLPGGAFGPVQTYTGSNRQAGLLAADSDQDGITDVVVAGFDLTTLRGVGDGGLRSNEITFVPGIPADRADVLAGDLDGDGIADALAAIDNLHVSNPNAFQVLLGSADGFVLHGGLISVPKTEKNFALGDFNGDQRLDVLSTDPSQTIRVRFGDGAGGFGAAVATATGLPGTDLQFALGDCDGNGTLDMVASVATSNLRYLPGVGDGTFGAPVTIALGTFGRPVLGLISADASLDIAVPGSAGQVQVFTGNGNGTFTLGTAVPSFATTGLQLADLNGDGRPDLVGKGNTDLLVALATGHAAFGASFVAASGSFLPELADYDGDGRIDAASLINRHLSVLRGNGDGTFTPLVTDVPAGYSPTLAPEKPTAGDFDGDGIPDIAVVHDQYGHPLGARVTLFRNDLGEE